eukprot:jgi/Hompol1/1577/HPOL_005645-RA
MVSQDLYVDYIKGDRKVFAAKDIPVGTLLLVEAPIAWAINREYRKDFCAYCLRRAGRTGI